MWWGQDLNSCLATYSGAVDGQDSWLIGVRRDELLIACVEVLPSSRRVRQLLRLRNHPHSLIVHNAIVRALADCGATQATNP